MPKLINAAVKRSYEHNDEGLRFLIMCESAIERKNLGQALVNVNDKKDYGISIFMKRYLLSSKKHHYEHFDFIVFVIDLKKETSYNTAYESLEFVDLEFLRGKRCFMVFHDDAEISNKPDIELLEGPYKIPALYGNCSNTNAVQDLASRIMRTAAISYGIRNFV